MGLIDFILNVAALLLWLNGLSVRSEAFIKSRPAALGGTLKKAGPSLSQRWKFLSALVGLLFFRSLIYWEIGSAVNWTPQIQLVAINLPFRSHFLGRMFLYSAFSFLQTLAIFYLSLLLLSIVNSKLSDADPLQKLVRLHLGWCEKLPLLIKIILPLVSVAVAWWALHPLLVWIDSVPRVNTATQVYVQALLIGASAYLAWKYVIATFLLFSLLNNYIYLGNHPVWNYANVTSRKLLAPIRWLPLRFFQVDFAPILMIAVIFLIAELASYFLKNFFPA